MKVRVIEALVTRSKIIEIGTILEISEDMVQKLSGKVSPIAPDNMPDVTQEVLQKVPTHCLARKVGGRICGAPLKEGINGFLSCSDMFCQVPVG